MHGMWAKVQLLQNRQQAQVPQIQSGAHREGKQPGAGLTSHTSGKDGHANCLNHPLCTHYLAQRGLKCTRKATKQ